MSDHNYRGKYPKSPSAHHDLELFEKGIYLRVKHPDGFRPWVFRRSWGYQVRNIQSHALLAWNVFEEGWAIVATIGRKGEDEILRIVDEAYEKWEWMTKHRWVEIEQITAEQWAHHQIAKDFEPYHARSGKGAVHTKTP